MNYPFITNEDGSFQFRNAQYYRNNTVECEVNHKEFGWVPFLATAYDGEEYGRELYRQLVEEHASEIAALDNERILAEDTDIARNNRNVLLTQTDWTQSPDVPEATRTAYTAYRQQLRDLPAQDGFPYVEFPTPPGA